ncbi:MAG: polysaccharide biosynthesis tyrosine autokinase [Chitinophagaceae bacterium]
MQDPIQNNNRDKSELWNLSFRDLFYKYVRFLPVFVLSVAFALLAAFLYLRYTVPIYGVGGTMLIKSDQGNGRPDKFEEIFGNSRSQNLQNEMEILRSRPLMERVVKALHLQYSYYVKGKIKTVNIYNQGPFLVRHLHLNDSGKSFSFKVKFINNDEFRVNDEKGTHTFGQEIVNAFGRFLFIKTNIAPASNDYNVTYLSSSSAAGAYASAIGVVPKSPGTGLLSIGMRTPNPVMGADIINKLMEEYSGYSVEQQIKSSEQILTFIDGRLIEYGHKLDSVQRVLLNFQTTNNLIDAEAQQSMYFDIISEADKANNGEVDRLNRATMLDDYLSDKKNEFSKVVVPSSLGLEDETLNELVTYYNKVQVDRQNLIESNVPVNNPAVKEITGEIERSRARIRENLRNIKTSVNSLINDYRKRTGITESQLRAMPAKVKDLGELKLQVERVSELFKLLQEKKEETSIKIAASISNSDIIDRAYPSTRPIKPNRRAIQIMAILAGLGIPALFIFAAEVLNDKVSTRYDIEKLTSAPILGEIGHSYSNEVLVVNKTTRSMVAEQFRIIRSNLQYVLKKKEKATILVTSTFSGEGKSYVSTNMGAVLALAGKKTVILEFDIRKPKVLSGMGIAKGPGITNYLMGKTDNIAEVIRPVPGHENLFVLGCGPIPPNPAELLLDTRLDEMFEWLQTNFDIVLVDTAPVGMVSDAMTLSKFADCTLYLVRQGHTFKKQVGLIDEFYQEGKLPKVSIIINDVKLKPGYGYYGYGRYGYGYGYGYGSYYEEEVPPQNLLERILMKLDVRRLFGKSKKRKP